MGFDIAKEYVRIVKARQELADILDSLNIRVEKHFELTSDVKEIEKLRVACILDDFSFLSLQSECQLLQLTPDDWQDQIFTFAPHLLFVESAWKGKDGLWDRRISNPSDEIVNLVQFCSVNNIPTLFWNKEDPVHFNTFIGTAKLFDFIFTTDIDSIRKYKSMSKKETVYLLPFAAQPKIHNPIEKYDRKDAFCFAGSYYKRYPDRQKNFSTFFETLSKLKKFDIYDRYMGSGIENYSFPDEYKGAIVGQLPPNEVDLAYKGYFYGLNMNSIKQSQSMFARRVFELLASNTIVISNYSRGMRTFFGDITISTDNSGELLDRVEEIIRSPEKRDKVRLAGLRNTLLQHTYHDRLKYVVAKVFGASIDQVLPRVTLLSFAREAKELDRVLFSYERQTYPNKKLIVIFKGSESINPPNDVLIVCSGESEEMKLSDALSDCVAFIHPDDYYGVNYLTDLVNAKRYQNSNAIGKVTKYESDGHAITINDSGLEYDYSDQLMWRSGLFLKKVVADMVPDDIIKNIESGFFHGESFGIDRFNYCMNYQQEECPTVDDLPDFDTGLDMKSVNKVAESITKGTSLGIVKEVGGGDLFTMIPPSKSGSIGIQLNIDGSLTITSGLESGHEYIYFKNKFKVSELDPLDHVKFYLDADPGLNLSLVLVIQDSSGNKMEHTIVRQGKIGEMDIPDGGTYLHYALRAEGSGSATIRGLVFGDLDQDRGCYLSKGEVLAVVNQYPEYDDLYRNAFIHSRVKAYRKEEVSVDVVKIGQRFANGYYEFNNVDVATTDNYSELHTIVDHGNFKTILVHFLSKGLWDVLKQYSNDHRIFIWVHGFEIQPYFRREYNYKNEDERNRAIKSSDERTAFWKTVFERKDKNVHFIFVSNYFANEVMGDIGVQLESWQYSVIHNFIDTQDYEFKPRDPSDRLKILSIRSFASPKYANDQSVKAILELSTKPFFDKLEFRIIGDGALFNEITQPIEGFANVTLEKRFLPASEYRLKFLEYGIFLTPTRWDSQGVSRDEAMSTGMVIISNRISGVPEFVDDKSGILVEPEDYQGIAKAIETLYNDPELFTRLSVGAGIRVRQQNGFSNTIRRELDLITEKKEQ